MFLLCSNLKVSATIGETTRKIPTNDASETGFDTVIAEVGGNPREAITVFETMAMVRRTIGRDRQRHRVAEFPAYPPQFRFGTVDDEPGKAWRKPDSA
jgi:hypothetical protein